MEIQFRQLDILIATQPMPDEYQDARAVISCNDCSAKSQTRYHWLGLKCSVCHSYNTVEHKLLHMPGVNDEEEESLRTASGPNDAHEGGQATNALPVVLDERVLANAATASGRRPSLTSTRRGLGPQCVDIPRQQQSIFLSDPVSPPRRSALAGLFANRNRQSPSSSGADQPQTSTSANNPSTPSPSNYFPRPSSFAPSSPAATAAAVLASAAAFVGLGNYSASAPSGPAANTATTTFERPIPGTTATTRTTRRRTRGRSVNETAGATTTGADYNSDDYTDDDQESRWGEDMVTLEDVLGFLGRSPRRLVPVPGDGTTSIRDLIEEEEEDEDEDESDEDDDSGRDDDDLDEEEEEGEHGGFELDLIGHR